MTTDSSLREPASRDPSPRGSTALGAPSVDAARFGSGQAVQRVEDAALLAGRGQFTDNVAASARPPSGDAAAGSAAPALHLAFVRSPYAHARLARVDTAAALAMPGVVAVYTGADLLSAGVKPLATVAGLKRADGSPAVSPVRHALAPEVVRFVGEAVAAVVADSREAARDGCEAVLIDYDERPAVVDAVSAGAPGAAIVCDAAPDNIAAELHHGDIAATAAAFERAAHRISLDLVNQRLHACPIEPRSAYAAFDEASGRLTYRSANQMPTAVLTALCAALPGLASKDVRVVVGDVGGGFGMKTGAYPEDIVLAHAARTLRRAVRWQADRSEDFVSATHGRDVVSRAELALDADGRALALRVRSHANVGGYATMTGVVIQVMIGPWVSTSIYDIPTIDIQAKAMLTHTAPTGAYRGAGRPEAIYQIERLFDAAARELAVDPAALRRRNMIRPDQMPYRNAMGQTYDCGRFEQVLDRGLALADWNGYDARRAASSARGKLRGRGIATFLEWTGGNAFEERVTVDVSADGYIEIGSATQAMGQGIATSYVQLAVDTFGVPIERIRIVQGDTDRANGFGSAGSRSLFTGGSALQGAAEQTVALGRTLAAEALEAAAADIEYRAGRFGVVGTDLGIDLFELASRQPDARIHVDSTSAVAGPSWPNGCHVCEVEVDPDTGHVDLVRYASVNDIGRVVSPVIARGQVEGGAVQGIGQALGEHVVYDADSGQLLSGSFMDYAMPRADFGQATFETEFDTSTPCTANRLGVKGVGELGTIGATPAVVVAVIDALTAYGLGRAAEGIQMPVTAQKVWRALNGQIEASPLAAAR